MYLKNFILKTFYAVFSKELKKQHKEEISSFRTETEAI